MRTVNFYRISAAKPSVRPGAVDANVKSIIDLAVKARNAGSAILVCPELCITGYTCADLFESDDLLQASLRGLSTLVDASMTDFMDLLLIVGLPLEHHGKLYNCAVAIFGGGICGVVPKSYIPNYGEFYEKRWFESGRDIVNDTIEIDLPVDYAWTSNKHESVPFGTDIIFEHCDVSFGIEICEDLWVPTPPSNRLVAAGADIIFNLSATNELIGKHDYLLSLIRNQSARCRCAYAYASAGLGESSTDLAFAGNCIIAENGSILAEGERFSLHPEVVTADIDISALRHDRRKFKTLTDCADTAFRPRRIETAGDSYFCNPQDLEYRYINPHPFVDSDPTALQKRCDEISSIQAWGLLTRLKAIGCKCAVVGISGGLDSTLALLVTVKAFDMLGLDRSGIIGITMPGFGTTGRTYNNAVNLIKCLGVSLREISIANAVNVHFEDIGHNPGVHDVTYENSQARERTQILMDVANREGGIVIGTGDLSELALGWCTYNGDQMSMYAVNASVPKTLVRYLVEGYARRTDDTKLRDILLDICDTPVSPELLPADAKGEIAQKTEDLVGPYELHDFFLYEYLRHGASDDKIRMMARKAFAGVYDDETIDKWLATFGRRFFSQQFKRSCMPDGVKVGSVCLSPRGDWRMPSDAVKP